MPIDGLEKLREVRNPPPLTETLLKIHLQWNFCPLDYNLPSSYPTLWPLLVLAVSGRGFGFPWLSWPELPCWGDLEHEDPAYCPSHNEHLWTLEQLDRLQLPYRWYVQQYPGRKIALGPGGGRPCCCWVILLGAGGAYPDSNPGTCISET